jgi:hypothetical protein
LSKATSEMSVQFAALIKYRKLPFEAIFQGSGGPFGPEATRFQFVLLTSLMHSFKHSAPPRLRVPSKKLTSFAYVERLTPFP